MQLIVVLSDKLRLESIQLVSLGYKISIKPDLDSTIVAFLRRASDFMALWDN